jgi:hypothetical protein
MVFGREWDLTPTKGLSADNKCEVKFADLKLSMQLRWLLVGGSQKQSKVHRALDPVKERNRLYVVRC